MKTPRYFYSIYNIKPDGEIWVDVFVEDIEYSPQGIRSVYFGPKQKAEAEYGEMTQLDPRAYREYMVWLFTSPEDAN